MQLDKQQIIDFLRSRGNEDQAQQAQQELPDQVDTDQHSGLLEKFGVDLGGLQGGLGGLGDKLGL